jgi:hypothetical protein
MSTIIDYAAPMMRLEELLKEMHNSLLDKDLDKAYGLSLVFTVESRILRNTIIIMKEKEEAHALRQQAPTLQEGI